MYVESDLCYLIYLRHLIRLRASIDRYFFLREDLFSFIRAQHFTELPSKKGTMFATIKVLILHNITMKCLFKIRIRVFNLDPDHPVTKNLDSGFFERSNPVLILNIFIQSVFKVHYGSGSF